MRILVFKESFYLLIFISEVFIMAALLEQELATYQAQKNDLLGKARGKFVLIKNDQVVGIFDTQMDAIHQGYERFGHVPFLVKEILEFEVIHNFTSFLLDV
jgi:hypothetical protein